MVLGVPDPADSRSNSSAEHGEAVGPFAASAFAGLEEDECIVVAREPLVASASFVRALVGFDLGGTPSLLVWEWGSDAEGYCGRVASRARWVVDPLEEGALEPPQQCADDTVLVAPSSLLAGAETVGLGLQDLALLVGLAVDLLQRHDSQGLVQQPRVLPSAGHLREGEQHVAEAHGAQVAGVRRLGDQRDVPERRVRWRRVLCGRLRCSIVPRGRRRRAGVRHVCGEVVHALGAEDGTELVRHLGGQLVHFAGRCPRRGSRVLHGGRVCGEWWVVWAWAGEERRRGRK